MKKIILGISILGMSFGMQGQTNVAIGTGGTTTASDFHYDSATKNVGIGTVPTNHNLTIFDDSGYTNIAVKSVFGTGNIFFTDQEFSYAKTIRSDGSHLSFGKSSDPTSSTGGTFTSYMAIDTSTGNVGIGTITTGGHKLAVDGSIGAREVKVETTVWPDFVFEKTHKLPNLKEVEAHILENGHLENIPSAKEVEKNGFFLGEMDAKLLQKIEELTLYTIEQEKQLKAQNTRINTLAAKLLELQLEIEKLKK